jgi:hypothetical protein
MAATLLPATALFFALALLPLAFLFLAIFYARTGVRDNRSFHGLFTVWKILAVKRRNSARRVANSNG